MANTYGQALARVGVTVPEHLAADAEVPVLTGPQAQGDLLVVPVPGATAPDWDPVGPAGVQLIRGEATGNTHWLHAGFGSGGVACAPPTDDVPGVAPETVLVLVRVPQGQSALLIHTDEHGANGIGPGTYAVCRKREHDGWSGGRYVED